MTGILLIGGDAPRRACIEAVLERADVVVAADSGIRLCRNYRLRPRFIVGDMDSIGDEDILKSYPEAEIRRYPRDKDETDTELGLQLLEDLGMDERIIIGGGGGRLDHLVAVLSLFHRKNPPDRWISAEDEVRLVDRAVQLSCRRDELISFFPVGGSTARMTSTGLKWPLDGLVWRPGDAGVSNVAAADTIRIEMIEGRLIAVRRLENKNGVEIQ